MNKKSLNLGRSFIFCTALLDRFNPELCNEITSRKDALQIISRLEQMNLFLIPLDIRRKWYRYHHMFSEVVGHWALIHEPGLISSTLRKAANWLAANNHLEDAIRCAYRSRDFEFAADLMEDYITLYTTQLNPNTGLRWILRLPPEILKKRTLLKLYQGGFLLMLTKLFDVKEILETIENQKKSALTSYSDHKRRHCEDFTIFLKSMLQILHADQFEDITKFKALSKKISQRDQLFSIRIESLLVFTFISRGELALAEASFARVAGLWAANSMATKQINLAPFAKIYSACTKALIARHKGRLCRAEEIIIEARLALNRNASNNSYMEFYLHKALGRIFYLQNRLDDARECAALANRYRGYNWSLDELLIQGCELQLLLHLAADEKDKATEYIQKMRDYSIRTGISQITAWSDTWSAWIAIEEKNLTCAAAWSQRRGLTPDEPFSLLFAMECLTQARLYYAEEKYSDAVQLMERLRRRCLKRALLEIVLQIDILHCAVLYAMNQHQKAVEMMKKALSFSETQGYVRPLVNDVGLIAPVLKKLADELPHASWTKHFEKIIVACDIEFSRPIRPFGAGNAGGKDLTPREIEILELISQGLKNREIAQRKFISIHTVKSHAASIIAKLNAQTRTQAVHNAQKIGIIN